MCAKVNDQRTLRRSFTLVVPAIQNLTQVSRRLFVAENELILCGMLM